MQNTDKQTVTDSRTVAGRFYVKEAPIPNCSTWLVIDSESGKIVEALDNDHDARGICDSYNDALKA